MYPISFMEGQPRNVVIYARVSTEHEAQLSALENQKDWYKPYLEHHPEWTVVRMYVDEGITGTSAKKRPQFMQMIEDAENGEFDLILTREVSRFARNTVDTLQYTRQLKAKGVEVYFINDNIKTFDGDGELRLTIMATLAQDESRKTSIRVKAGQQTSMENGVFYGNGNILGYDRVGKDMVVNPDQAKTVRMIYDWYLDGFGVRSIQFKLEQAGRKTATGKTVWHLSNISKILQNSFYCGLITYHKQWTPDYLEQKKINNLGDMEYTIVRGSHKPIISESDWNQVQEIMKSRKRKNEKYTNGQQRNFGEKPPSDVWVELLQCECGHKFNRKVWHRDKVRDITQYGYQCYSSIRSGTVQTRLNKGLSIDGICAVPMIPGWKLKMMAKYVFNEFLDSKTEIIELAESMIEPYLDEKEQNEDNSEIIEQKQNERNKLKKRLDNLIEMRADEEIDKALFLSKKEEIESQINEIEKELLELKPELGITEKEEATNAEKLEILRFFFERSLNQAEDEEIPEEMIRAFVKKIIVHKDSFEWHLRYVPSGDGEEENIKNVTVEGRQNHASISSVGYMLHRLQSTRRTLSKNH